MNTTVMGGGTRSNDHAAKHDREAVPEAAGPGAVDTGPLASTNQQPAMSAIDDAIATAEALIDERGYTRAS